MNCPQCNTWNPDDKNVCWRCQAELPRPVEKPKKRAPVTFLNMPLWAWVMIGVLIAVWIFAQCGAPSMLH